jgi:VanZ family protein
LPVVVWMGVIFVFSAQSSLPSPEDPLLNVVIKKLGHITVYAILALLMLSATAGRPASWRQVVLCLCVVGGYGLSDEYHQSFVANRTPALTDVLFDMIGGSIGAIVWQRLRFALVRRMTTRW